MLLGDPDGKHQTDVSETKASSNTAEPGVNENEGTAAAGIDKLRPDRADHTVYAIISAL